MPAPLHSAAASPSPSPDDPAGLNFQNPYWCPEDAVQLQPDIAPGLARTIESEIIPRLLLAHRSAGAVSGGAEPQRPITVAQTDVEAFAKLILHQPLQAAQAYLDGLRLRGLSLERVIVDILSPAARHLGLLWEQDRCTFVDVTLGLSRLQQLLRLYGPAFECAAAPQGTGRHMLLAVVPGEQHTFGLAIVEEFFRRAGWRVDYEFLPSEAVLEEQVRSDWFDVVGLSASGEVASRSITKVITCVRSASRNKDLRILLGGNLFSADPTLAVNLGADVGVRDASEAVGVVERLFPPRK